MVIVDPPAPLGGNTLVSPKDVKDLGPPTSTYTALYYPWLSVGNPHYNPDTAAKNPDVPHSAVSIRGGHVVAHRHTPRRVEGAGRG